jgi:hypothetical protein
MMWASRPVSISSDRVRVAVAGAIQKTELLRVFVVISLEIHAAEHRVPAFVEATVCRVDKIPRFETRAAGLPGAGEVILDGSAPEADIATEHVIDLGA